MALTFSSLNPLPALLRRMRASWSAQRHAFYEVIRGETTADHFDVTDAAAVNAELESRGVEPLCIDDRDAERNPARFILANLICNRAVRQHYRMALNDGGNGDFCAYLLDDLPATAQGSILDCFAQPPGEPVKRVLEVREDLRKLYPFALTPHQRRPFLVWLLTHGRGELGITAEAALWCLLELDETRDRGLIPMYLVNPEWQAAVPHALTVFGWPAFIECLRESYSITGRWLRQAKYRPTLRPWDEIALYRQAWPQLLRDCPNDPTRLRAWLRQYGGVHIPRSWWARLDEDFASGLPTRRSVNVVGHYRYPSGLQEACAGVVKSLELQSTRVARRDLPVHFPSDWRDRDRYQSLEVHDTTIYVAAVNTFPREYYRRSGLRMRGGVRRIAVWYWELDRLPDEWRPDLQWASEVWAPTRFLADAYRNSVKVPVVPMLPGVSLPAFPKRPRRFFDLPEDRKLVLFSFDMGSVMERKNPLGLIEAFRRAFRPDDRVHLCIKVSRGEFHRTNLAVLEQACRSIGATLLDRVLIREEALALMACADCYASLHRAEGLGLGLAESMLMGIPAVGTAYSGNLDFMTSGNSFLVDATPVPVENVPPYPPGSSWAEPDIGHAAKQLRAACLGPDARAVAERGQREVAKTLSVEAAGRRMIQRLAEIGA